MSQFAEAPVACLNSLKESCVQVNVSAELQALVYHILPPATAIIGYAIGPATAILGYTKGLKKLSANRRLFVGAQILNGSKFVTDNSRYM